MRAWTFLRWVLIAGLVCENCAFGEERLASPHDNTRRQLSSPETLKGVIALGGTAERTREAGRLARRFPHLRVIVSGAEPAGSLQRLGPNIARSPHRDRAASRNTHENAVNAVALVKPKPGDRWLLITSNWHMRRALCAFRTAGFEVEPWPIVDRAIGNRGGSATCPVSKLRSWATA